LQDGAVSFMHELDDLNNVFGSFLKLINESELLGFEDGVMHIILKNGVNLWLSEGTLY
jgi:hypothetical protein